MICGRYWCCSRVCKVKGFGDAVVEAEVERYADSGGQMTRAKAYFEVMVRK
jgi:hypothetical protein